MDSPVKGPVPIRRTAAPGGDPCRIAIERTDEGLVALRDDWAALYRRAANPSPFAAHDWIGLCWERHRAAGGRRLNIVTVAAGGRIVLIAPLLARRDRSGFRVLSWIDSMTPCYCDLLMEDSREGRQGAEMLAAMLTSDLSLRRIRLNAVLQDAAAQHLLRAIGSWAKAPTRSHRIILSDHRGFDDFLSRLSGKTRGNYRRSLRQLAGRGEVVFEAVSDPGEAGREVDQIFARKQEAFANRNMMSAWLFDPGTIALFRRHAMDGVVSGAAALYRLRVGGHTVAAEFAFRGRDRLFLSKTAYDPAWADFSPGMACRMLVIERAFADGLAIVDLMTGRYPWKESLSDRVAECADHRVDGRLFRWTRAAFPVHRRPAP
jgi:CelD/BcsL family acetyltransferase involved in cellulose biosynthesis